MFQKVSPFKQTQPESKDCYNLESKSFFSFCFCRKKSDGVYFISGTQTKNFTNQHLMSLKNVGPLHIKMLC